MPRSSSTAGSMARLGDAVLQALPATVQRPAYDRRSVTPGIVHLGVGAFHRAHQAVYLDDCLGAGETGWGIVGVSLRSPATRDALAPQDGLYSLLQSDADGSHLRVVGSTCELLVAPEDPAAVLGRLVDPRTRIVTLTITEKGYKVDLGARKLLADDAEIRHDLAEPAAPVTALGFLAEALARRRAAGIAPFTVLSCDNLPGNGALLRRLLLEFAGLRDPGLRHFIEDEVAFPSTMVDRIVPATTDRDRETVAARLGVEDAWPVVAETFGQWVIEDRFTLGRPALEHFGAEFVADVDAHEKMKLRLLNGAHSSIAAIGRLADLATVADAVAEPSIVAFLERYWAAAIPTLSADPAEAQAYTRRLLRRFANRALQHRVDQIASDASQKLPQRILSPLLENRQAGRPAGPMIFAVAAWIRSCGGRSDGGRLLPLNDPSFQRWAGQRDQDSAAAETVVGAFLGQRAIFGDDLPAMPGFRDALLAAYRDIRDLGVVAALAKEGTAR